MRLGWMRHLCAGLFGRWPCAGQHGAHTAPCCGCRCVPGSGCSESALPAPSQAHCSIIKTVQNTRTKTLEAAVDSLGVLKEAQVVSCHKATDACTGDILTDAGY